MLYTAPRITSKELKRRLEERFPDVVFSVRRLRSSYCNFLTVRWPIGELKEPVLRDFVEKWNDESEPMTDGVELGKQLIILHAYAGNKTV